MHISLAEQQGTQRRTEVVTCSRWLWDTTGGGILICVRTGAAGPARPAVSAQRFDVSNFCFFQQQPPQRRLVGVGLHPVNQEPSPAKNGKVSPGLSQQLASPSVTCRGLLPGQCSQLTDMRCESGAQRRTLLPLSEATISPMPTLWPTAPSPR